MNPILIAALAIVQLATRIIELRLKHYEINPELAKQDADNAVLLGEWGQRLLKVIEKLVAFVTEEKP